MTEPLRAANEIAGNEIYKVGFYAENPVTTAINGMAVSTFDDLPKRSDINSVIVCASYKPEISESSKAFAWLRWLYAHGVSIGSADTGAFILAKAGLLTDGMVTLHWANLPAFKAKFPEIKTSSRLMEFSRRRFSCAGATTGIDMMLHIIAEQHGDEFKSEVANHFIHMPERNRDYREQSALSDTIQRIREPVVQHALMIMENTGPEKLTITELARTSGVSVKQLERAFKRTLNDTPVRIYQKIRLQKAHRLINQTNMSVEDIAHTCGFASRSQFSRAYKAIYLKSPNEYRHNHAFSNQSV